MASELEIDKCVEGVSAENSAHLPGATTEGRQSRGSRDIKWNAKLEQTAKSIGESAKSYKLMHIKEAQRSSKTYTRLMIIGIIIGPLSGVLSAVDAVTNTNNDPTIPIIITFLGFLTGIIVTIVKFARYEEISNANKHAAARYTSIETNVRRQLGLSRIDRISPLPYMEWLETKYEELFLSAPLLPAEAYDRYANISKKLGLCVPSKYETVININNEERVTDEDNMEEGSMKIKRATFTSQFPGEQNDSDKMLQYELKRMMTNSI